jgi:hypothetical protein
MRPNVMTKRYGSPMNVVNGDLDEFRTLVHEAYEQARRSGRPDWGEMTSAVLKNRLLQITQGGFSQERYGSPSFMHLVRRVPDLLAVASDNPPFRLHIIQETGNQTDGSTIPEEIWYASDNVVVSLPGNELIRSRIRDDLWHAVIDYASGKTYVLDPDTGLARPCTDKDPGLPTFSTVSRNEIALWRHEFIETLDLSVKAKFTSSLNTWADGRGKQSGLPGSVRGSWAEHLKRRVIKVLLDWFHSNGIQPPEDMVVTQEVRSPAPSESIGEMVETRHLRDLIIRAVRVMTHEELSQISLPAGILLRISRPERGSEK